MANNVAGETRHSIHFGREDTEQVTERRDKKERKLVEGI